MTNDKYNVVTGRNRTRNLVFIKIENESALESILTFITPNEARQVAASLTKIADECERVETEGH
jgi:hypothetical protein